MSLRAGLLVLWLGLSALPAFAARPLGFEVVSPQGFGDRHNTKAWSMAWWRGRLYVGTAREHLCLSRAAMFFSNPFLRYPPLDRNLRCTEDMRDLPLQAEIWRYDPGSGSWDRVFRSPLIVNPAAPGKWTARDAGFRNLVPFTDADGTEALYALGMTSEAINPGMPPPRILRTTDGEQWEAVPQDASTMMGRLGRGEANFRAAASHQGGLYVVNGDLLGVGRLLVSEDPARGGDAFRVVSPPGMSIFEIAPYDGELFVSTVAAGGYGVARARASDSGDYAFTPVVESGAYARGRRAKAATSMHVYGDRLYVGTDRPGELVRVNPDRSWDLVVGRPRSTPEGWKEPLSGLGAGFDYSWANHLHRMVEHQGSLYVAVNDAAGVALAGETESASRVDALEKLAGFDLFSSADGVEFSLVTLTGFGDPRENVVRVFASTPDGLFAGTANPWSGLRVYRGRELPNSSPEPPRHLSVETTRAGQALTWEGVAGAARYRVLRRNVREGPEFEEAGVTAEPFFVDVPPRRGTYHYFVRSEDALGELSPPSNLARAPSLQRRVSLARLESELELWSGGRRPQAIAPALAAARRQMRAGELASARAWLERARRRLGSSAELPQWRILDADTLFARLRGRVRLAEAGVLSPAELETTRDDRGK
jgi:hypothetical protein